MKKLNSLSFNKKNRPIKIMQFGEGNFLRAFVEWILQDLNDNGVINSNVVVVQPRPQGRVQSLKNQDGLYTLCLEGIDDGHKVQTRDIVDVLGDFVNPYEEYQKYLDYARSEELQIVISNTTEAGIVLDEKDVDFSKCPNSFPGKLLALLEMRYNHFNGDINSGLAIIPCELIDHNGETLKSVLNALATIRGMSKEFIEWLNTANHFTDTLVDRIVPGYPKDTASSIQQETGYLDENIVKAEIFHLWVLKDESHVRKVLPADKTGLNIVFAKDITPYKQRKVKILNGTHTAIVPIAYLCGIDTVREAIEDEDVLRFANEFVYDVVVPTIPLPHSEMIAFATSIFERFQNPFIRHELMSIALNSTTKFVTRLLPSYNDYLAKFGSVPRHILFSYAALCVFYNGKRGVEEIALNDDANYLEFWKNLWKLSSSEEIAKTALSRTDIWGQNLASSENVSLVARYIDNIRTNGMRQALKDFLTEQ